MTPKLLSVEGLTSIAERNASARGAALRSDVHALLGHVTAREADNAALFEAIGKARLMASGGDGASVLAILGHARAQPHPGAAFLKRMQEQSEAITALKDACTKAAAELRHTYGHVALGQAISPDLVARAIRILEEAVNVDA